MLYEQTSGTISLSIYEVDILSILLLEDGRYILLEIDTGLGNKALLENYTITETGSLFPTTSGTNPDPFYEEN